jgi:hypothetical protein
MGRRFIAPFVLVVALGVSSCGSVVRVDSPSSRSTAPLSASPSASSSSASGGPVLLGVPVPSFGCPPKLEQGAGRVQVRVPAGDVSAFTLCPMSSSHYPTTVRVVAGNVHFRALLEALTAADAPRSNGMCPLYADVTQVILARTRTGVVRARIPIDGCGHYQHVDVLMAARAS